MISLSLVTLTQESYHSSPVCHWSEGTGILKEIQVLNYGNRKQLLFMERENKCPKLDFPGESRAIILLLPRQYQGVFFLFLDP